MSLLRPATVLVCVLVVLAGCGGPGDGGDGGENATGVDEETTEELENETTQADNGTGIGEDNETGNETGIGNETGNETGLNETGNETGLNETDNETGIGNETVTADTGDLDVEEVRNNHVESLQEAGSATVVIESDRPSVQERQVVQMDLNNQTTFRRSVVTTDGDENVTVFYTADGTTYVRDWNESGGPADYRVIEGEGTDEQNDSAFGNDTNATENESTFGNDTETENDSAFGNDTNATENESTFGNDTNATENESTFGNESDVGGESQGEIAEHQKQYVELQNAFTVIQATNWTEEGEVERNGKNVTLYTADGADKLHESGIPENLTSDEGTTGADTNESTFGNDTNATENDSAFGNDTETENDSAFGNDTNATENESMFGNDTNATENESMTENDSMMGNESGASENGVTDYSAVLVVGPNGTVERFSYDLTVENESGDQTVEETYITRDVGDTTVSEPGWLDIARERAGAGTGAEMGNESGNMTNESGDLTGNESGNMTANETGNMTGNETGNETGA